MNLKWMRTCFPTIGFIALTLCLPGQMRADSSLTLTLSPVTGAPGETVTAEGVIANPGTNTLFLNNESFTLGSAFFSNGNTDDFFLNAPISLDGGTNTGIIPIAIFTFDIATGTPGGAYSGNFLDILGGPGFNDQNVLVSTEFSVTVTPAATSENGSFQLLAIGLLLISVWTLSRRKVGLVSCHRE